MISFSEFFKKKDPIVDIIEVNTKDTKVADYLTKEYKRLIDFKELEVDGVSWILHLQNYDLRLKTGDLIVLYRKHPYWEVVERKDAKYQSLKSYEGKFKHW